jgi:hypothetical protein
MSTFSQFLQEYETTLQYHDELNSKLWHGKKLKPEVRKHLLKIAKHWIEFADIPEKAIIDIIMTGGNANYNYTKFSDIDVHIVVERSEIADCEDELVEDYLKDKKTLWSLNHDIKVYGYNVELYAQDIEEPTSMDQGVYSLLDDKWISEPKKQKVNINNPQIRKKAVHLQHIIDYFIDSKSDDLDKMNAFKDKLRDMRSSAIQQGGEFSVENLVFKELRNLGYLDKFSDYIINAEDKKLSLKGK